MLHALIMAGGGGTRFWPRSRSRRPKQFLNVVGERTLLQMAYDRIEACAQPAARTWVITGESHRQETHRQLPELLPDHIVGEPCGRDTAPCIGLGAALIARQDPEAIMLVTPADHVIEPARAFARAVHVAEQMVQEYPQAIVTFGIRPLFAATGYGYIHRGPQVAQRQGISVHRVSAFREKPALPTAEEFFQSGEYDWNSGIFVWRAATILAALRRHRLALHDAIERIADAWTTPRRQEVLAREYPLIDRVSIDFAVMQEHKEQLVVQAPFQWDDVGSWLAVERMHPQDAQGNTVLATHHGIDTRNCVIVGERGKLITTIGVEDLVIIQDGDSLLIAHRSQEGTVKQLVDELGKKDLKGHL